MAKYAIVSVVSGILFGVLDGLINANPMAQRLYDVYKPIAKISINPVAGIAIDLVYGFVMAGEAGIVKGISFALVVWFFRVVMYVVTQWMMFNVPVETLLYTLIAGLGEMLILGILYGLALKPSM